MADTGHCQCTVSAPGLAGTIGHANRIQCLPLAWQALGAMWFPSGPVVASFVWLALPLPIVLNLHSNRHVANDAEVPSL